MKVTMIIDPQSWPKLQDILPKHSASELQVLKKNIEDYRVLENGVYWVDKEGNQWILDGVHRKEFSGGKMEWKFCGIPPENSEEAEALGLALNIAKRNLSPEQLKELWNYLGARETIQKLTALKLRAQGLTQAEAGVLVGLPQQTLSDWEQNVSNTEIGNAYIDKLPEPPDLRVSIPKAKYEGIYVRHLKGETQEQIAADYKVSRPTISNIISKERSRLSAKPNKEEKNEGGELALFEGLKYPPKPWDVWNYSKDKQYGLDHPGNIPAGMIFNLLYFYTEPSNFVVDPMAGGGVVGDVCAVTNRRYMMYDIKPTRPDIHKNDLTEKWPLGADNADLVFLDPPYYKKLEEEYGPESISALNREDYLAFFGKLAKMIWDSGAKRVALLMSDYTDDEDPNLHIFVWDYVKHFTAEKWIVERHIMAPLPTQQVHPDFVEKFRKSKKLARLGRSLVIFRRP